MYTCFKKFRGGEEPKQGLFQFLVKAPFILGWYVVKEVTSVPRQVILDSCAWSERFRTFRDIKDWKFLLSNGVCAVNVVQELGPITRKRIHYLDGKCWNFNPPQADTYDK
jgi:hypothetical protein